MQKIEKSQIDRKRISESEKSNSLDFRLHIKSKFQGTLEDV